jgi:hypothetical protein
MNKIKSYYWWVGIPIALVALGSVVFFDLIASTIRGNPHPEINYIIFVLMVVGCAMMLYQVRRMNADAKRVEAFYEVALTKPSVEAMRAQLAGKRRDTDGVLEIMADLLGKQVSSVQHSALESELERYHAVQSRYLIMPNYMSGMMVGMGLLGTFIGLLGALSEISKLIGAFSVTNSGDPSEAIRMLVERLTSPMQAMGVAFSASLFGVLGSLIMGVLLVFVRNCTGEMNSLIDSRVTYLTDFSNADDEGADVKGLSDAVTSLAEQSPILANLAGALAQSETRVRNLIGAMVQISSHLELNQASNSALVKALQSRLETEDAALRSLQATQESMALVATRWSNATQVETQIAELVQQQTYQTERFMTQLEQANEQHQTLSERLVTALVDGQTTQAQSVQNVTQLNKTMAELAEDTVTKLGDIAGVQRRSSEQMTEIMQKGFSDLAGVQRRGSDALNESTQTGFSDLAGAQRRAADETNKLLAEKLEDMTQSIAAGQTEQIALTKQVARITDALTNMTVTSQNNVQKLIDLQQRNFEKTAREQSDALQELVNGMQSSLSGQTTVMRGVDDTLADIARSFRTDAEARALVVNRMELQLQDYASRLENFTNIVAQSAITANTMAIKENPQA